MKTWEMTRTLYKVSDFVSWQRDRTLSLSPSFQRRPVWKPGAKSYLIDTVVRGLPIPIIFLREQSTDLSTFKPVREVVDGQQRIRTVLSYVDPGCLIDYKKDNDFFTVQGVHNEELAGKTFSELSSDLKLRILDYQFSVHVFPSSIDDREVLQLFARLNATGVKLTSQELRNAEYFGILKTSAYALAAEQLPRWRHWKIFTEYNIARMEEVELVSEFVLLMLKGVTGKSQVALDKLYEDKNENYAERGEVEKRFRVVMDSIEDKLESQLVFLPFNSKTLFYSLFAAFYDAHFGLKSSLTKERIKPASAEFISRIKECGERIQVKTAPEKVMEAVARRTTHVSSRNAILNYLLNK
jgi:uncharacterized protein with ParB-like and HNH nuclease domain